MAVASPCAAQIVNVLDKIDTSGAGDDGGFAGAIEAGGNWKSGNVDVLDLTASASLGYRNGRHLVFVAGNAAYGFKNSERYVNKDLEHLRYRIDIIGPLSLEAFAQHDRNEFRRRALRGLVGIGPRVELMSITRMNLDLGIAYMPELERLSEKEGVSDSGLERWTHRGSAYLQSHVRINKRLSLDHSLFLQPALDEWTNLRVFSELGFEVDLWKYFSLRLAYVLQVDTKPPETVHPADAQRKLSLKASF
jgi:putative salt-induced outer membrane protein YdiY